MAQETLEMNVNEQAPAFDPIKARLISKRRRVSLPQWATAWIVLIPALIFLVLFMFYPIINTFLMAFIQDYAVVKGGGSFALGNFLKLLATPCQSYDKLAGECVVYNTMPSFGFGNFAFLFTSQAKGFVDSIFNTMILVVVEVPLTIIIALLLATFLNSIKAVKGLFQTIFFLPYVTNTIALGLVFNMLFSSSDGGLINALFNAVGLKPVQWLSDTTDQNGIGKFTQGVVIVIYAVWNGLAFKILVFLSGLATIDKQYTDAAKIDGSSSFTIWRRITLPLLSPQILYITITSFIGAFKMYTGVRAVYVNQDPYYFGGMNGETWMPVVGWIYRSLTQTEISQGVAAAGSLVLLGIILLITLAQFAVSKRRVHY